jgi:hypothetical protein
MTDKQKVVICLLIILSIMFTVADLIASGLQKLTLSLIFSSVTTVITCYGSLKTKLLKVQEKADKYIKFIKSNFNKASIVFAVLDVICSIIAVLSGIFIIALISRSTIALRLLILMRKYKTVGVTIWFIAMYYFIRRVKMADEQNEKIPFIKRVGAFFKKVGLFIWANKKSICGTIFATISGITTAIATNEDVIISLPALPLWGINMTAVIVGVLVFAGVEVGVIGKGFETISTFIERVKVQKTQKEEEKEKALVSKAEKKQEKAEAKKLAQAQKLVEQRKKEAEAQAKTDEQARARAIAQKEIEELADKIEQESK